MRRMLTFSAAIKISNKKRQDKKDFKEKNTRQESQVKVKRIDEQ
jgi:hypothetical protein